MTHVSRWTARLGIVGAVIVALVGCGGGGDGGDGGGGGQGAFNFNEANMEYAAGVTSRIVDGFAPVSDLLEASFVALATPGSLVAGQAKSLEACAAGAASLSWTDVDRDGAWSTGDTALVSLTGCRVHAGDAEALGGSMSLSFSSVTRGPPRDVAATLDLDVTTQDGTAGTLRGRLDVAATSPTGYGHAFTFRPTGTSLLVATGAAPFELACFEVQHGYGPVVEGYQRRIVILGSVRALGKILSFSPGAALMYHSDDQPAGGELYLLSFMSQPNCPALGISDGVGDSDNSVVLVHPEDGGQVRLDLYRKDNQLVTSTTSSWWELLHPETPAMGIINATNGTQVASLAVTSLALPLEVGAFTSDVVLAAYRGAPIPLCTSGEYSVTPSPTIGGTVTIAFASCTTSMLGEAPVTLGGTAVVKVAQLTGAPDTGVYTLTLDVAPIDVTSAEAGGASRVAGSFRFHRTAAGADVTEEAEAIPGASLALSEEVDGVPVEKRMSSFLVRSAATAGGFTLWSAGDQASVASGAMAGQLAVHVTAAFQGTGENPPDTGALKITASDGTSLTLTAGAAGAVTLGLDDDGDGVVDATLSTSWTELE